MPKPITDKDELAIWHAKVDAHNAAITAQIIKAKEERKKYVDVSGAAQGIVNSINSFVTQLISLDTRLDAVKASGAVGLGDAKNTADQLRGISQVFIDIMEVCAGEISKLDAEIAYLNTQFWRY